MKSKSSRICPRKIPLSSAVKQCAKLIPLSTSPIHFDPKQNGRTSSVDKVSAKCSKILRNQTLLKHSLYIFSYSPLRSSCAECLALCTLPILFLSRQNVQTLNKEEFTAFSRNFGDRRSSPVVFGIKING